VLLRRSLADASVSDILATPGFYLGFMFYAASFLTFLLSLRRFEVLTVYPVFSGLAYASVTIAAVWVLGEHLTAMRVAGIVLVGAGVALLVR
jgi:multidrug transporter EmrE-like cation transporter